MLKVSIDGNKPEQVECIIVYDENVPIAAMRQHGEVVYYCDAARDPSDLKRLLDELGLEYIPVHVPDKKIVGSII